MCSTNIHVRTQMQFDQFRPLTITYLEQHRLFNQIRQQESYCSEALAGNPDLPAIWNKAKKPLAPH